MARRIPDKLDLEAKAASDAGMSYGKWKAMQNPVKIEPNKPNGTKFVCAICGKEFYRTYHTAAKYCSDECRDKAGYERAKENAKERKCKRCGKEFVTYHPSQKYCGPFCARLVQNDRMREYLRSRKEKERNAKAEPNVSQD